MSETFVPVTKGIPPIDLYLWLLVPILVVWYISFQAFHLYRPRRMGSHVAEFFDLAKANTIAVLVLVAFTFFLRQYEYSRLVFFYFWLLNLFILGFSRMCLREIFRVLRRAGYNKRYVLIVGAGKLGQRIVQSLGQHPEFGMSIRGFLTRNPTDIGRVLNGVPIIGTYSQVKDVISSGVDIVLVCLPASEVVEGEHLLEFLSTTMVEVKVIPSIYEFMTIRTSAEMFEGLPIITLQGSPLYGWNIALKRGVDLVGGGLGLVLASPVFLVIAVLVKMTSPGEIFYRQMRMGLDGVIFEMVKFRTMTMNAESKTGPMWTQPDDHRRTRIGVWLRKTSLDELPQLWNVLKGDMSLVGPRPERPELIGQFNEKIHQYMLRHKMKAGMTGWAQVNGYRGNTSLEKRIEYDLFYIEHWSIWFDIKILWMTLWRGFIHRNAY